MWFIHEQKNGNRIAIRFDQIIRFEGVHNYYGTEIGFTIVTEDGFKLYIEERVSGIDNMFAWVRNNTRELK